MGNSSQGKNKYLFYMHAGSGNHGCEAIVRSLCGILDDDVTVLSYRPDSDKKYGLDSLCDLRPVRNSYNNFLTRVWFHVLRSVKGHADDMVRYEFAGAAPFADYKVAVSIGGDNYCYSNMIPSLKNSNHFFDKKNIPTALVGCSIEPELMHNMDIVADMKKYRCIIARETLTYNALCKALNASADNEYHAVADYTHIYLTPDPAFALKPQKCELPTGFRPGHTIGINVSPMILDYESEGNPGITLKNYKCLIRTILEETDESIALIPHVVTENSDDRKPLKLLKDYADQIQNELGKQPGDERVMLVEDHPADELKYIISNCSAMIAARTHASIAAYSSCVPTLVVGYSVKSRGIAEDLFGTADDYVIPVQELVEEETLTDGWRWLEAHAQEMREYLNRLMPDVVKNTEKIESDLREIFN